MNPTEGTFDLVLQRSIDVPRSLVWKIWTEPEHLVKWYTPAPWSTPACEIDLRPGGIFRTVMRSPEGEEHTNTGCYLEVVPETRLVWTDALQPGYRPSQQAILGGMGFITVQISLEDRDSGTQYTARAMHKDAADRKMHEEMGFHDGWGAALDQLVALAKTLR